MKNLKKYLIDNLGPLGNIIYGWKIYSFERPRNIVLTGEAVIRDADGVVYWYGMLDVTRHFKTLKRVCKNKKIDLYIDHKHRTDPIEPLLKVDSKGIVKSKSKNKFRSFVMHKGVPKYKQYKPATNFEHYKKEESNFVPMGKVLISKSNTEASPAEIVVTKISNMIRLRYKIDPKESGISIFDVAMSKKSIDKISSLTEEYLRTKKKLSRYWTHIEMVGINLNLIPLTLFDEWAENDIVYISKDKLVEIGLIL